MIRNWRAGRAWCIQHPITDGIACGVAFFIASSLLIGFAFPAWALSIPITERIVINLGDLHPWISILVAFAVYWEMRKTKQHAAEAVAGIAVVKAQTDGVLEKVAAISKREGKAEEKREEVVKVAAAKDVASADAVRDAATKASITAIKAGPPDETKKL